MENTNKTMKLLIVAAIMMVGLSSFASALGISIGYWKENPLKVFPGESKDVLVNLQNSEAKEITVRAELLSGSDIARFTDASTDFALPAMSVDNNAHLRVEVPSNAIVGSEYMVTVSIKTVNAASNGIALGSALQMSFPVVVVEKPVVEQAAPAMGGVWTLIGVVALIAVLWALMNYLRKGKKKRK